MRVSLLAVLPPTMFSRDFFSGGAIAVTALATAGRFFMNWAGTVCNVYVQELFPTSIRCVMFFTAYVLH